MKTVWHCAVLALLLLWGTAQAKVLYLSPAGGAYQGLDDAAYNAFKAAASNNIVDGRGQLSNPPSTPAASAVMAQLANSDVVVLGTIATPIDAGWMTVLRNLILNRPDLTFLVFADGCCVQGTNVTPLAGILKEGTGWDLTATSVVTANITSNRNPGSLYSADFSALPSMVGRYYALVTKVPPDNALYLPNGITMAPTGLTDAYGLFVPHASMNGGQGACVFFTGDMSPFGDPDIANFPSMQPANIAAAFMTAATNPQGACSRSTREPDLVPTITGPTAPPPGQPAIYQVTITNNGATDSTDGTVTVTLPAGLALAPTVALPNGCVATAPGIVCTIGAVGANGGSIGGSFTVIPTTTFSGTIGVAVASVGGEVNTANNTTQLVAATPPDLVAAITGPSAPLPGVPATYQVTISNQGGSASASSTVTITLPAGLVVDAASLPASCAAQAPGIVCNDIVPVAAGGSVGGSFVVTAAAPLAGNVDVRISAVLGAGGIAEVVTNNNQARLAVAMAGADGGAHAVPALDLWALLSLAGLVGLLARRRRA